MRIIIPDSEVDGERHVDGEAADLNHREDAVEQVAGAGSSGSPSKRDERGDGDAGRGGHHADGDRMHRRLADFVLQLLAEDAVDDRRR